MTHQFENRGHWYRGNLHMHTTRSDGALSPEEAIAVYKAAGYDFIALTDHRQPSRLVEESDFLQLPGVEWDTGDNDRAPVFHIVGVGMERECHVSYGNGKGEEGGRGVMPDPQALIDAVREAGGLAILAHPAWSLMDPADIGRLSGLSGAEIYNTVSGLPMNARRADSSQYIDLWAAKGIYLPCMAADDSHRYTGEQARSYLMVNAEELTAQAILRAIADGNFYASQGPRFENISFDWEKGTVDVFCSPDTETVVFCSNAAWSGERVQRPENGMVHYRMTPIEHYLRVELIDKEGRMAWSSPVAVKRG
ncbi:MAG: CehA/McbA family metallohydrolase [Eubacteriales bacterium]|nr:CehA/McbA family metallohydrolase [Eubacteriales bacterium]